MEISLSEDSHALILTVKIRPFRYGNSNFFNNLSISFFKLKSDRFGMEISHNLTYIFCQFLHLLKSDHFGMEIFRIIYILYSQNPEVKIRPFRYGNVTDAAPGNYTVKLKSDRFGMEIRGLSSDGYKKQHQVKIRPFRYGNLYNSSFLILPTPHFYC